MTREQFSSLVEGSQKVFRRFLVALCCGDSQLADDIAQEAYIKAFLSCEKLINTEKFKAWLFRIGYNTFINHKRSARIFSGYDEAADIVSDSRADAGVLYQDLYAALNMMSGKERTSVLLFYMQGYSIKEIAEIEETSQDAVKQHLSRGRNHLRGLLSNQ